MVTPITTFRSMHCLAKVEYNRALIDHNSEILKADSAYSADTRSRIFI